MVAAMRFFGNIRTHTHIYEFKKILKIIISYAPINKMRAYISPVVHKRKKKGKLEHDIAP